MEESPADPPYLGFCLFFLCTPHVNGISSFRMLVLLFTSRPEDTEYLRLQVVQGFG